MDAEQIKAYEYQIQLLEKERPEGWQNRVQTLYAELIKDAREHGSESEVADKLYKCGIFLMDYGKHDQYLYNLFSEAYQYYRKISGYATTKELNLRIGYSLYAMGSLLTSAEQAIPKLEEAASMYHIIAESDAAHRSSEAYVLKFLADKYHEVKRFDDAQTANEKALKIFTELGQSKHDVTIADICHNMGVVYKMKKLYAQAETFYEKARIMYFKAISTNPRLELMYAKTLSQLIFVTENQGKLSKSREYGLLAAPVWKRLNAQKQYTAELIYVLDHLAYADSHLGNLTSAKSTYEELLVLYRELAKMDSRYVEDVKRTENNISIVCSQQNKNSNSSSTWENIGENIGESLGEKLGGFLASLF